MPSSERNWNMPDVWRRLMRVTLSRVELDEPQIHDDGRRCGTNSRTHHRAGLASSGSRTRVWRDTENSEIREQKTRSAMEEKQIERLEGKVAEQTHLLQETLAKVAGVEQSVYTTQASIDRLEKNIAKLDRDLQEMTAAIRSIVNRGDARNSCIQSPEANAPDWSQGPQDKIAEPSNAESRQSKRPAITINHLETDVVVLDSPLPKPLSSEDAGGRRDQKNQKQRHTTEGRRNNKPLPQAPIGREDDISVTEVAELVRALNAQLEQTSCLIADSLSYRQSPISDRGSEVVSNELRDCLGLWLYRDLQRRSSEGDTEPDQLITQVVLQTALVNACSRIINGWTLPDICQGVADAWRAQTRTYTSAKSNSQVNEKYLISLLWELINAVGGSLQSDDQLPTLYQEDVKVIANRAVALHRIINEEAASLKLVTYTTPCGAEFDPSRMDDTEGKTGSTPHDRVICTVGMGLQCRERVEQASSRQDHGVSKKVIVVLASTLEAQGQ